MAETIEMPKLSDTMTVGTLAKWLKKEGDAVKSGEMIAEVETDKATMELESFVDGTLLKIFAPAGSQVPIGAALCAIGKPGESVAAPAQEPANAAPEKSAAKAPPPAAASGHQPAPGPSTPAKTEPESPASKAPPGPPPAAPTPAAPAPSPTAASTPAPSGRVKISPLARKLATEKGLDPSRIPGTGPGGRIIRADVLSAEKGGAGAPMRSAAPSGPIQPEELVPVTNIRATIARRLLESKAQIPHFYLDIEIDAGPVLALRAQLNSALEKSGVKLSVNDFILKASAEALRRVPGVNCSWEEPSGGLGGPAIRRHAAAHVSFAVAIEDGLITPVIRDTHAKTLFAISDEVKALAKLAREKKLQPPQYTGGTFCVSNLGMMGVDRFSAIINPPNAAILAVGATVRKPVVEDGRIVPGDRMSLTLSCDHRVVDGALGATFLAALRELLEKPALLLL